MEAWQRAALKVVLAVHAPAGAAPSVVAALWADSPLPIGDVGRRRWRVVVHDDEGIALDVLNLYASLRPWVGVQWMLVVAAWRGFASLEQCRPFPLLGVVYKALRGV